ncbi:MAG: UDP-N-acetylglucosamine pyrophosphorylase, partial [Lachnospiraceae bacterium]|nr:UDP-N-acetylglucosamine pyrophosphorylase [Lachnospiraceae bacterium]
MNDTVLTKNLYDLNETLAKDHLLQFDHPWEALAGIGELILKLGSTLDDSYEKKGDDIWIAKSAKIHPNASITGPCIIGHETEVRPGAFIRGKALVGDNCVVGNSTELKNVILFNHVQV